MNEFPFERVRFARIYWLKSRFLRRVLDAQRDKKFCKYYHDGVTMRKNTNRMANNLFGSSKENCLGRLKSLVIVAGSLIALNVAPEVPVQTESGEERQSWTSRARKANFSVPPELVRYFQESEEQRVAWERALEFCTPIDTRRVPDDSCMSALDEYLIEQPVWEFSVMYYYVDIRGLRQVGVMKMNRRDSQLPFSYADYAMGEFPIWSDVFDGLVQERQERFLSVVEDVACRELSDRSKGGVLEDMHEQCSAREMYKYAAYLDACATASQRLGVLNMPHSNVRKFGDSSAYDVSMRMISEKIEDQSQRDLAIKRLRKGYLHAHWVVEQCTPHGYVLLPNTKLTNDDGIMLRQDSKEFLYAVWDSHSVALTIAARSGDEWAIRSFPLGIGTSDEIHHQVMEKFPLLMHRFFGSPLAGFDWEPTWKERSRHLAKAYLLLEKMVGTEVALREIDASRLQEEIDYVRSGGELKYPVPLAEVREKRAAKLRE